MSRYWDYCEVEDNCESALSPRVQNMSTGSHWVPAYGSKSSSLCRGSRAHEPVRGATRFAQNIVHLVALSTGLWLKVCTSMLRKRTSHKRRRPRSKYISRHSISSGGYKIRRATKFGRSTRLRTTDFESRTAAKAGPLASVGPTAKVWPDAGLWPAAIKARTTTHPKLLVIL